jgi:TusA-related sulfurtransferase
MKNLLKKLSKLFEQKSQIELYIISKNPQSTADVEHWARKYSQHRGYTL